MAGSELNDRFPKMKPIKSTPPMFRLNGCGVALYGSRDSDPQTNTYVATLCLSLVFVPVFCLTAYRVARAQKGWYFVGWEPLSKFAKSWNVALLAGIVAVIVGAQVDTYRSSPGYQAKQKMASAQKLVAQGQLAQAAQIYLAQIATTTEQAANATAAMKGLMDNDCKQAPLSEDTGVFVVLTRVARDRHAIPGSDVVDAAMKLVADKGDADPRNAVGVLDAVRPLLVDTRAIDARRLALLQKAAATDPTNLEVIVPLASLLQEQDHAAEARKLLMPVKDKLGDGEGARVLGTILGGEGDYDGAYALLWPYVKTRLDRFHDAEKSVDDTWKSLSDRELNVLRSDQGPQSFYDKYNAAAKPQQQAMLSEYVEGRIKNDPGLLAAQEGLEHQTAVVPVALELGIVMLQRAQGQTNPDVRKDQLQSAEQVFLAIGGVAGQSDQYRLSLGQVDYWLGKQAEGRKLFDDYLTAKGRTFEPLLQIATRLRLLGSASDARTMAEEAYNKAAGADEQHEAAVLRSVCFKDTDDRIAWLNKADASNPSVKAELAQAMGEKAFLAGQDDEAARQFHVAVDTYSAMPRSASTLNQTALSYSAIFRATGDHTALERCFDNFQQAVELEPADSILLYNAGVTLVDAALSDVCGSEIDLHALHETGSTALLAHLYRDENGRQIIIKRVKEHPGIARGLGYLSKAMVLSPKAARSYAAIEPIHLFTRNDAALLDLETRLKAADLDTSDQLTRIKEFLGGVKDQHDTETCTAALKRAEDMANLLRPKGGVTAAVAICEQADAIMAQDLFTDAGDAEKVISLAEEAERLHPSVMTSGALVSANLFRAAKRLRGSDPSFDAFYKKYRRTVGTSLLMADAANEPSPFQKNVVNDPDVKKAAAMIVEQSRRFPKDRLAYEWKLLKGVNPAEADKTADALRQDTRKAIVQSIATILSPDDANTALDSCWLMTINGKKEEGQAAVKRVADLGIPVPVQP